MIGREGTPDLAGLIDALVAGGVEFIVVGGAAAVLHGAPTTTHDLDIVHRTSPDNVDRLMKVLNDLNARVRDLAGRELGPTHEALLGSGQVLLRTSLGALDLLCRLHDGRDHDALLGHTIELRDADTSIRVVDLDTLIEIKSAANRARDRLVLPLLIALRRERDGES